MIQIDRLNIDGKIAVGLKVCLPESPPLVAVIGEKGFVMCGFLNIDAAERLGVAAAMVSGVSDFDDILKADTKAVTSKAKQMGAEQGMKGREAVKRFF